MDGDVLPGQRGRELAQRRHERGGGEVPDLVVVAAELEQQRLQAGAALQRQLDLDRDPPVAAWRGPRREDARAPARRSAGSWRARARTPTRRGGAGSSRSRTSVTASMWEARAALGRQVRKGEPATRVPARVSQRKEGPAAVSCLLSTQPARRQRSRSQRPVRWVLPISRASWSTVIAYCSPIRRSSCPSRSDSLTLPASALSLPQPATNFDFFHSGRAHLSPSDSPCAFDLLLVLVVVVVHGNCLLPPLPLSSWPCALPVS